MKKPSKPAPAKAPQTTKASKTTTTAKAPRATASPAKATAAKPALKPPAPAKAAPVKSDKPKAAKPATTAAAVTVWHNPACGSSKNAVAYLEAKGITPAIYLYLKERPTKAALKAVLKQLKLKAADLLRPGEAKGEALGVYGAGEEAILDAMAAEPSLIQRPVVITAKGAVIARPKTKIDDIL